MKTFKFPAVLDDAGKIALPIEVTSALPPECSVDVVVFLREDADPEDEDDELWRRLALKNFFDGYAESDAIYDEV